LALAVEYIAPAVEVSIHRNALVLLGYSGVLVGPVSWELGALVVEERWFLDYTVLNVMPIKVQRLLGITASCAHAFKGGQVSEQRKENNRAHGKN
jgi:hypothetical protein